MLRTLLLFVVFAVLVGAGLAIGAWPRANAAAEGFTTENQLMQAYSRVREGMPASRLAGLGFDPAHAKRLSALALMEYFTPKSTFDFDALAPVIQDCFQNRQDCIAYIFPVSHSDAQAVLLVEGGRVAWKNVSGVNLSLIRRTSKLARG